MIGPNEEKFRVIAYRLNSSGQREQIRLTIKYGWNNYSKWCFGSRLKGSLAEALRRHVAFQRPPFRLSAAAPGLGLQPAPCWAGRRKRAQRGTLTLPRCLASISALRLIDAPNHNTSTRNVVDTRKKDYWCISSFGEQTHCPLNLLRMTSCHGLSLLNRLNFGLNGILHCFFLIFQ